MKKYEAMVLSCMDPRFQPKVFNYLKKKKLTGKYSSFTIAGAAIGVTSKKFKKADKLKCIFVVVLGENEIKNGLLQLKNLKTGDQQQLTFEETIEIINKKND